MPLPIARLARCVLPQNADVELRGQGRLRMAVCVAMGVVRGVQGMFIRCGLHCVLLSPLTLPSPLAGERGFRFGRGLHCLIFHPLKAGHVQGGRFAKSPSLSGRSQGGSSFPRHYAPHRALSLRGEEFKRTARSTPRRPSSPTVCPRLHCRRGRPWACRPDVCATLHR